MTIEFTVYRTQYSRVTAKTDQEAIALAYTLPDSAWSKPDAPKIGCIHGDWDEYRANMEQA